MHPSDPLDQPTSTITSNLDDLSEDDAVEEIPKTMTLNHWITVEGPRRLKKALKSLGLSEEDCKRTDFGTFNSEDMGATKRNVKNELKYYDSAFIKLFQRNPSRTDKEPMRPLYMYYQNLRKAISKGPKPSRTQSEGAGGSRQSSVGSEGGRGTSVGSIGSVGGGSVQGTISSAEKIKKDPRLSDIPEQEEKIMDPETILS